MVHWTNHWSGKLQDNDSQDLWSATEDPLSRLDQQWFKEKRKLIADESAFVYQMREGTLEQHVWCSLPHTTYTALTPDNSPSGQRTSFITTVPVEQQVIFVQALHYDACEGNQVLGRLEVAEWTADTLQISWNHADSQASYHIHLLDGKVYIEKLV
ncbi:hypothetical protein [Paenibacillus periandrae]|uniref:hypothetical protein n=1 Tax=Paenibacillus periandrae TaxID=1761741 RepID=UPI001F090DD5|nr:hypothetical protein [Paenibacillus periandrae]